MKIIKRTTIIVLILVAAAYIGSHLYLRTSTQNEGPSIFCDSDLLEVSVTAQKADLLAGITASDPQDGDLSENILIGGISKLISAGTAKITYLVFDSDDNMASCVRQIRYTDYESPRLAISTPLVFSTSQSITLLDRLNAVDLIDGDISHNVRVSSLESTEHPDIYATIIQATNSLGDTAQVRLPVYLLDNNRLRPTLTLSEYLVYLNTGDDFDPADYLVSITAAGSAIPLNQAEIDNPVDTDVPGTYWVTYSCSSESSEGSIILTVVVR